jgi:hypothetical protein
MSDKSTTSTTNKVSYQILTCRCRILQSTLFKEPDDPVGTTGQPVRLALILNVTVRPNLSNIVVLGLTILTNLFLITTHDSKTRLTSQQSALLIKLIIKSSLGDVRYYKKKITFIIHLEKTLKYLINLNVKKVLYHFKKKNSGEYR